MTELIVQSGQSASAADIVSAALLREQVDPKKMGTLGYVGLVKGRPHLSLGLAALLQHPFSVGIALIQMLIVYIVAHDAVYWNDLQLNNPQQNFILLGPSLSYWQSHYPKLNIVKIYLLSFAPFFAILNLGWGLMAADFTRKFRPAILLSFIGGSIPFRFLTAIGMPRWWFYSGEWRANMAISARILQFSFAYHLATGRSKKEIEMDWAHAFDKHLKVMMDAFCSYSVLPALWLTFFAFMDYLLVKNDEYSYLTALIARAYQESPVSSISIIGLIAAWLAFERACLAAMTFSFLQETQNHG